MKTRRPFMKVVAMSFAVYVFMTLLMPEKTSAQMAAVTDKPVWSVSFLNAENEYLVFYVTIHQSPKRKTWLRVLDDYKETMYTDLIGKNEFSSLIKIPKQGVESLEFFFASGRDEFRKSYRIQYAVKETVEVIDIKEQ